MTEVKRIEIECPERCNACPYALECDKDEFYWDDYEDEQSSFFYKKNKKVLDNSKF